LLKADYIDVDNLSVAEAATFFGDAQSGNFGASSGWRILQSGNVTFNDGTFRGRIEADTGYIASTLQIGGTSQDIGDIQALANSAGDASAKVASWTRPGSTLIDGNKIFTGDAYVDTLEIKGRAVTFLQAQSGGSGTGTVISFSFNHQGDSAEDTLITFGGLLRSGDSGIQTNFFHPVFADLRINGSTVKTTIKYQGAGRDHVVLSTVISIQPGNNTVSMVVRGNYGPDSQDCYVSAVACKR